MVGERERERVQPRLFYALAPIYSDARDVKAFLRKLKYLKRGELSVQATCGSMQYASDGSCDPIAD